MKTKISNRRLAVVTAALLLSAVPTAAASSQMAIAENAGIIEGCFLLPVESGQLKSDQWCVKAPAGTRVNVLLAGAPAQFDVFLSSSTITLGIDYDGDSLTGSSFEWWASDTCAVGRNYIGDFPSDWNDRASSANLGSSSNGCNWFKHYEHSSQGGEEFLCGRDSHDCTGIRMHMWFNNKASSVRFTV